MTLTTGQQTVLATLSEFGPATDAALATYVHHIASDDMSSSGVRTRRSELASKGYVEPVSTRKMKSGRNAAVWGLTASGKKAAKALSLVAVV